MDVGSLLEKGPSLMKAVPEMSVVFAERAGRQCTFIHDAIPMNAISMQRCLKVPTKRNPAHTFTLTKCCRGYT